MDTVRFTTKAVAAITLALSPCLSFADAADYRIGEFGVHSPFDEAWQSDSALPDTGTRSEMLFKLTPAAETDQPEALQPHWNSEIRLNRIDFLKPGEARMHDLHQGFSYSASIDVESDEFRSDSRLISSRQLGIHYGRLGSVNYSGVDLSFRQFSDQEEVLESDDKELWSLGVTTGRRFSMTGLEPSDPMWTVSLRGQFSLSDEADDRIEVEDQQWYLSPGLHWERDSFMLSADVLMPFMQSGEYETETDYRIRANIQKRF
jgi:hypothetical protein